VIANPDGQLTVPIDYAADLLDTLDLLGEVLRYASHELRHDIVEHYLRHEIVEDYQPGTYEHLIETVDHHASVLRRVTSPGQPRTVTR
jgi:hypothetical protein